MANYESKVYFGGRNWPSVGTAQPKTAATAAKAKPKDPMREADRAYMASIREARRAAEDQRRCDHAIQKYERRLAQVKASALRFETRGDFTRGARADYGWAHAHGLLDDICAHMRPRWSRMVCYHTIDGQV